MTEDDVRRIVREEIAAAALAKHVHVQRQGEWSWTLHQGCKCGQCQLAMARVAGAQAWALKSGRSSY